jgi:hypothetical protein
MAGKIIYHGECNNPPHREFVDAHVTPLVREVVGPEPLNIDILIARPPHTVVDNQTLREEMELMIDEHFPDAQIEGSSAQSGHGFKGFTVALVNERNDVEWRFITQDSWNNEEGRVKSYLRNAYWKVLNKLVTKMLKDFHRDFVAEGA